MNCHICGGQLESFEGFGSLRQIASDCQPYKRGGCLAICHSCGTVQRPVTAAWQQAANEIYGNYQLFSQGVEQLEEFIFHSNNGKKTSRSFRMLSWLDSIFELPSYGSLLEIGCGNGGFIASFSSYRPQWKLTGLDVTENGKQLVETIPNACYVKGSLEALDANKKYDLVVLSHTLEHIPNALIFLQNLSERLVQGGMVFIQGPNLTSAPFDILVADHCSFFTPETMTCLLQESGLQTLAISNDALPKEMSVLGQKRLDKICKTENPKIKIPLIQRVVIDNINFLFSLRSQALKLKENSSRIGIFGSSISSSWLFGELSGANFFVDESPERIGNMHLGIPIISPGDLSNQDTVLMPFRYDIAESIIDRLDIDLGLCEVLVPPPSYSINH